jgi:hypothetical protein
MAAWQSASLRRRDSLESEIYMSFLRVPLCLLWLEIFLSTTEDTERTEETDLLLNGAQSWKTLLIEP